MSFWDQLSNSIRWQTCRAFRRSLLAPFLFLAVAAACSGGDEAKARDSSINDYPFFEVFGNRFFTNNLPDAQHYVRFQLKLPTVIPAALKDSPLIEGFVPPSSVRSASSIEITYNSTIMNKTLKMWQIVSLRSDRPIELSIEGYRVVTIAGRTVHLYDDDENRILRLADNPSYWVVAQGNDRFKGNEALGHPGTDAWWEEDGVFYILTGNGFTAQDLIGTISSIINQTPTSTNEDRPQAEFDDETFMVNFGSSFPAPPTVIHRTHNAVANLSVNQEAIFWREVSPQLPEGTLWRKESGDKPEIVAKDIAPGHFWLMADGRIITATCDGSPDRPLAFYQVNADSSRTDITDGLFNDIPLGCLVESYVDRAGVAYASRKDEGTVWRSASDAPESIVEWDEIRTFLESYGRYTAIFSVVGAGETSVYLAERVQPFGRFVRVLKAPIRGSIAAPIISIGDRPAFLGPDFRLFDVAVSPSDDIFAALTYRKPSDPEGFARFGILHVDPEGVAELVLKDLIDWTIQELEYDDNGNMFAIAETSSMDVEPMRLILSYPALDSG